MPPLRPPRSVTGNLEVPLLAGGSDANGRPASAAPPASSAKDIVSKLERDMVVLESIASRIISKENGETSKPQDAATGRPSLASSHLTTSSDPEVTPRTALVKSLTDIGGDPNAHCMRMGHSEHFSMVFNLPLPSACTDVQNTWFQARFLRGGHTYEEVVRHCILSPSVEKAMKIDGECKHLRDVQQCVIDLLLSFFETLDASLPHGTAKGTEVFKFISEDQESLFICIKLSTGCAEALAQIGEYSVQLSPDCLDKLHIKIDPKSQHTPAFVNYESRLIEDGLVRLYQKSHPLGSFSTLRHVDSVRLLYDKLTDYVDLPELERMGLLSCWYLPHHKDHLRYFHKHWANFCLFLSPNQPIEEIRDYFGEGVAFYFLFVGFLAKGLLSLLPVAVVCSVGWLFGYENAAQLVFCVFNIGWSTMLQKLWRRTEGYYSNKWGTDRIGVDVKERVKDPVNPEFHGTKVPSKIDGNIMELRPIVWKQRLGYVISWSVTIAVVSAAVVCVYINQVWVAVAKEDGRQNAGQIGAVVLAIQIQCWDKIWDKLIVDRVTALEQHVKLRQFEEGRMVKTIIFKFISTFYAFFYIAYVQQTVDPKTCPIGSCKLYLVMQLFIVFLSYITFGVVDMGLPYTLLKVKTWLEDRESRKHGLNVFKLSFLEQQSKMMPYTGKYEDGDYLYSLFPVTFVMLFGTMMPASVLLAFLALSSQIRSHAWKLTNVSQRPFPVRTNGIGIWDPILNVLTYVSVFNTIGLLVTQVDDICSYLPHFFTITDALQIRREGGAAKLIAYCFLQNTAIILKMILDRMVSDDTAKVRMEKLRQEVQRARVSERGHIEIHEEISLRCSTKTSTSSYNHLSVLKPGDELYEAPFV